MQNSLKKQRMLNKICYIYLSRYYDTENEKVLYKNNQKFQIYLYTFLLCNCLDSFIFYARPLQFYTESTRDVGVFKENTTVIFLDIEKIIVKQNYKYI